ncbi:hypothetical protein K450DRAFT_222349 [Umbelopsis ramanniana AG]|uniref:PHD-type domain-containing protein n=1 Tax=Umbelopsis ramanniana AG TaxID=1314678 RepID=A0AAD5HIW4_UMBRA|nr:uncharacterized protein K450DRAFT_222349 [Umbelopsis ramanniana AG]KAI8583698.1 hypothetical protein K450DRAFT_222349 [Umbelopsis ramanniana AG]
MLVDEQCHLIFHKTDLRYFPHCDLVHPVCSQLPEAATKLARTYNWQCNECKSCLVCEHKTNEDELVFCSSCDRGCHTFCVQPPLPAIPKDDWFCEFCAGAFLTPLSMRSPSPTNATASSNDIDSAISMDEHPTSKLPLSEEKSHRQRRVSKKRTFLGDEEEQVIPPPRKKAQTTLKIRVAIQQPTVSNDKETESNEERVAKEQEAREYNATFGHKLTLAQADSQRGRPQEADRCKFEKCRKSEVK